MGKDPITKEKLSNSERIISGASIIVPGLKGASKTVKAVTNVTKSVNLPSYKSIKLDTGHITSGHTASGDRAKQSGNKDIFPSNMTNKQIESAIIDAYKNGKKVTTQGDRVKVRGEGKGMEIEMWVNVKTKTIETAYPKKIV